MGIEWVWFIMVMIAIGGGLLMWSESNGNGSNRGQKGSRDKVVDEHKKDAT